MNKLALIILSAVALRSTPLSAQEILPFSHPTTPSLQLCQSSPSAPDISSLTNIPSAGSFTNVTLELSAGTVMHGQGSFENVLDLRYLFAGHWFVGAEIQNSSASSLVDSAGLFAGARKAFDTAELYAQVGVRRTWVNGAQGRPAWEILAGGGAAWRPANNGFFSKTALYLEQFIVAAPGNSRPASETRAGIRFLF
jgi:hypothetical protein